MILRKELKSKNLYLTIYVCDKCLELITGAKISNDCSKLSEYSKLNRSIVDVFDINRNHINVCNRCLKKHKVPIRFGVIERIKWYIRLNEFKKEGYFKIS